jgi:ferric-dicitrate binding protein FerR (iron transport regulator)
MMIECDKKYCSYAAEDLLQDEFFIKSRLHPTKETTNYWYKLIDEGLIDAENYKMACSIIELVQLKSDTMSFEIADALWENIENYICRSESKKRHWYRKYLLAVASIIIFLVGSITLSYYMPSLTAMKIEDIKAPDTKAENIQLILADDEIMSLEGTEAEITYGEDGILINNQKAYLNNEQTIDKQNAYNQLIVPFGKRTTLTFSEGSRICINAGTRVVYPSVFKEDNREIYVDGEVYLDVFRDENRPFIVKTKKLDIQVLGTSFNLMAYEKDTAENIVLVSGLVKIYSNDNKDNKNDKKDNKKSTILLPNEMYTYTSGLSTIKTVDAEKYVSWKSGLYTFESERLDVVLKYISRYYGKTIECLPQAAHLKCSGKLDMKDNIELVLNSISQTLPIVWQNRNGQYIITKK